jgi:thymidine phosphorylase
MVHALGGPADLCDVPAKYLPHAPVQRVVRASQAGFVTGMATRDLGLAVIELGGGRHKAADTVELSVGFSHVVHVGQQIARGDALAVVHAMDQAAADTAQATLLRCLTFGDVESQESAVMVQRVV